MRQRSLETRKLPYHLRMWNSPFSITWYFKKYCVVILLLLKSLTLSRGFDFLLMTQGKIVLLCSSELKLERVPWLRGRWSSPKCCSRGWRSRWVSPFSALCWCRATGVPFSKVTGDPQFESELDRFLVVPSTFQRFDQRFGAPRNVWGCINSTWNLIWINSELNLRFGAHFALISQMLLPIQIKYYQMISLYVKIEIRRLMNWN